MIKNAFRWEFDTCNFINVYKNNIICAYFTYDAKLRIHVAWSKGPLFEDDWKYILTCVKEAKEILKKVNKI